MSGVSIRLYYWQGLGIAIASTIILWANSVSAEITPDETLPNISNVRLEGNIRIIEGGTTRGANLFHSFGEFSVPTSSAALFNNAPDIQNIISRVTGNSVSAIDGLIKTNGAANLFLINPSGIIFGANARLDIGGSFLASTASSLKFADSFEFSATNPQTTPLLTISAPMGLQYGDAKSIQVRGSILNVKPGQTLALVGGDVSVEGGALRSPSGKIELGGVADSGIVEIKGQQLEGVFRLTSLLFPETVARANILLKNSAFVDVTGAGGGSIAINARNLDVVEGSFLFAGIGQGLGSPNAVAGDITLNATEDIKFVESNVFNNVRSLAVGNGGNINISARFLSLTDGALLSASTFGKGNAGNINIDVKDAVTISGVKDGIPSTISSSVITGAKGNGGNIRIESGSLSITDGAGVSTSTDGEGNAGNVKVGVRDSVFLSNAIILSTVEAGGLGKGGDIDITAVTLSLFDGAQLGTSVFKALDNQSVERRDAGNININVTGAVTISGVKDGFPSGIGSGVGTGAKGNGGNIHIFSSSLSLTDGALLSASTFGEGNAGDINIDATGVTISGVKDGFPSGIETGVGRGAKGTGGNIRISTDSLSITDGAILVASTRGEGNAGNVNLNVRDAMTISGRKNGFSSGIGSSVGRGAKGTGGNIRISTDSLSITDGAALVASTFGEGNAGNVNIDATSVVSISGQKDGSSSGIGSSVESEAVGKGGDINISTERLFLKDAAQITASSIGNGAAGNLDVNARTIFLDNSTLSTDTRSRDNNPNIEQATINLLARDLVLLRRNSKISTDASGENIIGGNININSNFLAAAENSDITANSTDFRGGNVRINSKGIFGIQFRDVPSDFTSDITATGATRELSGNVEITPPEIDPTSGLIELPTNLIDASNQISTACTPGSRQFQNTFVSTGRGGLPMSPTEPLQDSSTLSTWVRLRGKPENSAKATVETQPAASSTSSKVAAAPQIVEASGWVVDGNGNIELVAQAPIILHSSWQTPTSCPVSQ
ncbi:filamentous hemagglutinin N-terminal domain-containing protein [Iningainema tapete]|uniref:Filamentous hemagglutinin N-terminal domain-containing protein n=1 Tax=Iningainema tapete BLCC-T55 TaxID=2748662 RepID=A0A8J6XB51_9CYAN|nr:filamentous hemagglutinin N-terminal domain-containing protein [Iningainema tapete]MBD2771815.1 filamentous hemagglutinin N-terminal domain-containing protein [Iningainema tapete BLCC-T55]